VDLGGTKTEVVALDDGGVEHYRARRPTPREDYAATLEGIATLVRETEACVGAAASVGVGTPGSVVPETGCMQNCNSTWLNGRPLHADLERRLGRRVALANDADCFALSEAVDGAGAEAASVFGVILGTGVGGALVVEGRLLRGANGIAGEWGHLPLPPLGDWVPDAVRERAARLPDRRCWCGRRNCIEAWLSGPGLAATRRWCSPAKAASAPQREDLVAAAAGGDEAAGTALDLHAWQLAAALATVVNVVDPEVVVLGGGLSKLPSLYNDVPARWIGGIFAERVRTRLSPPRHGDASGVRGAARLRRAAAAQRGRVAAVPPAGDPNRH
jgi:fructokinase